MLKFLGVSRSGYRSFLNRKISSAIQRKEAIKKNIRLIYDASKQNYGAPKITKELRKSGETITERTVGKYMREMGIKAQWIKPFTTTTRDSDFSTELTNILDEQLLFYSKYLSTNFCSFPSLAAGMVSSRTKFFLLIPRERFPKIKLVEIL